MSMQRTVSAAVSGTAGGLAGTVTMSALLLAAQKFGLLGRFPPERITKKALEAANVGDVDKPAHLALTTILHFGFGGSLGTTFGVIRQRLRPPLSPALQGLVFGALVWLT